MTVHEAAYKTLINLNKPSTYKEIYEYIKINDMYPFAEGVDEANVTRGALEKKCVNSTKTGYPKKEVLFYRDENSRYDLYEKLSEEEKRDYLFEKNDEIHNIREQLSDLKLEVEKLNTIKSKADEFNNKFDDFEDKYKDNNKQNENISSLLSNFEKEKTNVESLLESLKGNKHQLNIEKLDKGFSELLSKKEDKKTKNLRFLVIFGIIIIIIPIISIFLYSDKINLFMSIPIFMIEVFMIYYFRIILHSFNSIEEQILQLENRSSLLGFISDYVEFKKDNKVTQEEIEKFEDIIFSKISPNMRTIPTSPDMISLVEKVVNIIKK